MGGCELRVTRIFLAGLLVANLALPAWYHHQNRTQLEGSLVLGQTEPLLLLEEVAKPAPSPRSAAPQVPVVPLEGACFQTAWLARGARPGAVDRLQALGYRVVGEERQATEPDRYLVYFGPFASIPAALRFSDRLTELGVDNYVMTEAPLNGAVAVGAYRQLDSVRKVTEVLAGHGLMPTVRARQEPTQPIRLVIWASAEVEIQGDSIGPSGLDLEPIDCAWFVSSQGIH